MTKNRNKRSKPDESSNSTSISDFLDTVLKDEDSLKHLISEINKRDAILTRLVPHENTNMLEKRIIDLENQMDEMEQYSRRTCLKFSGIKETKDEDTDELVLNLVNTHILNADGEQLNKSHIGRSHRVGRFDGNRQRDIIVRFISYRDRAAVYRNKKKLKDFNISNKSKIYVNEALTRRRANLFRQTRQFFREKLIKNCWTHDGRIYVRNLDDDRSIHIMAEVDLLQFIHTDKTVHPKSRSVGDTHTLGSSAARNLPRHQMKQSSILGFGVMTSTPKATQREIDVSSTQRINKQEAQAPLSEMRQNSMLGFSDMSATRTHPRETTDLLPHGTQQQENT